MRIGGAGFLLWSLSSLIKMFSLLAQSAVQNGHSPRGVPAWTVPLPFFLTTLSPVPFFSAQLCLFLYCYLPFIWLFIHILSFS